MKRLKACRHNGCRNTTRESYCDTHKKQYKKSTTKHHDTLYNTQAWRKQADNHKTNNPICQYCNNYPVDVTDHYIEVHDLGKHNLDDNLVSACFACHNKKTKEVQKARQEDRLLQYYINNAPTDLARAYVYVWDKERNNK